MSTVPGGGAQALKDDLETGVVPERDRASGAYADRLNSGTDVAKSDSDLPPRIGASGSPPAESGGFDSGARVQAVAPQSSDAFSDVFESIQVASARWAGARDAGELLIGELGKLREQLVERGSAQRDQLRHLAAERDRLQSELQDLRRATAVDRAFLIQEQDRFLAGVLEEHEQALLRITAERDAAWAQRSEAQSVQSEPPDPDSELTAPGMSLATMHRKLQDALLNNGKLVDESESAREVLRRLQVQRDEAQQQALRLTAERDKAQSELFALQAERISNQRTIPQGEPPSTYPPPVPTWQGHGPVASDSGLEPSPTAAEAEPVIETRYPDLRSQPLKQKPNPSETPLGAYSIASEDLSLDHLDIAEDKRDR
ncbi:MAG TPA: hypothetical protein VI072_22210 [Polyangiaceae bacterium]